jgi:hypothetical protein
VVALFPVVAYCQDRHGGLLLRDIAGYIGPDFPEVQIVLHIPQISRIYHNAWNHSQFLFSNFNVP